MTSLRIALGRILRVLALGLASTIVAASCSSPVPQSGTNTNWVACKNDADCVHVGPTAVCRAGFCRNGPDAGSSADAGPSTDATPGADAATCWPPEADTSVDRGDGGFVGCRPEPGCSGAGCRSLCPPSDYELTCHDGSIAPPDASLHCSVVPIPTPAGVTYYCCPCGGEANGADTGSPAAPPDAGSGCCHTDPSGNPDCEGTLVSNADFYVDARGWTPFDNVAVAWSPDDSQGCAHSGSISVTNTTPYTNLDGAHPSGVWQCIPVTPGKSYDFSVEMRIPDGQVLGSSGVLAVWLYGDETCADLVEAYSDVSLDATGWQLGIGTSLTAMPPGSPGAPNGERSMKIYLEAVKSFRAGSPATTAPLEVRFDAVRVVERPERDGGRLVP